MAITTAQRNAGYRQLCLSLSANRPDRVAKLFRVILLAVKDGATNTEKEIAKAVARELYQAAFGIDPVGNHGFKHFLRIAIQDTDNGKENDGLVEANLIDAENIVVT